MKFETLKEIMVSELKLKQVDPLRFLDFLETSGQTCSPHIFVQHEDVFFCDHRAVDKVSMGLVSTYLRDSFVHAFRKTVPVVSQRLGARVKEDVVYESTLTYLESVKQKQLKVCQHVKNARQRVRHELKAIYEREVADLAIQMAMEFVFGVICNLATTHGRDVNIQGPPCACSFVECLECLDCLVYAIRTGCPPQVRSVTPTTTVKTSKTSTKDCLRSATRNSSHASRSAVGPSSTTRPEQRSSDVANARLWFDDAFHSIVQELNPMNLDCVKKTLNKLKATDGVCLWYAVAAKEMKASTTLSKGKAKHVKDAEANYFSDLHVDFFAAANNTDEQSSWSHARKAFATTCRHLGNLAYTKSQYKEASEHYTRAIDFDDENLVFLLNRAAALIKLRRFKDAEADCSRAIELGSSNYKAWYRRAVSKAGRGNLKGAKQDFERVLATHIADAKTFEEFRLMAERVLRDAIAKSHASLSAAHQQLIKMPSREEIVSLHPLIPNVLAITSRSKRFQNKQMPQKLCAKPIPASYSVSEVIDQINFAQNFCIVVHHKTGIYVEGPMEAWHRYTTKESVD